MITPTASESSAPVKEMSWMERQYAQSSLMLPIGLPLLVLIMFPVVLVLSGVVAFTSKHPVARDRAKIVFRVHLALLGVPLILLFIASYALSRS